MHVEMPKTVLVWTGNHRISIPGDQYPHRKRYALSWLAQDPAELVPSKEKATVYFQEKRRKTFSDVCHSKLITSKNEYFNDVPLGFYWTSDWNTVSGCEDYKNFANRYGQIYHSESNGYAHALCSIRTNENSSYAQWFNVEVLLMNQPHKVKGSWKAYYMLSNMQVRVRFGAKDGVVTSCTWTTSTPDDFHVKDEVEQLLWPLDFTKEGRLHPEKWLQPIFEFLLHRMWECWEERTSHLPREVGLSSVKTERSMSPPGFLLREPQVIMNHEDDFLYGRDTVGYFRNVAIQHAYLEAINDVPRMNENNISNILEIIGFMKSLVIDHRISVPKSLSDAWLTYRYSYGTTKMDAQDAIRFVDRHVNLVNKDRFKAYGMYKMDYQDRPITCRCEFVVKNKVLDNTLKLWRALRTYGLDPSFYTVWDMIPYSFIVDWFIPIGDVMTAWDAERAVEMFYEIENVNFSLSYEQYDEQGNPYSYYTRWLSVTPPALRGYYFLESGSVSGKTLGYRILDAASLIIK